MRLAQCRRGVHCYPRPPRGGRPPEEKGWEYDECISIHALREEGDGRRPHDEHHGKISIHALREEGDVPGWDADLLEMLFLSTPSARRATPSCRA